MQAQISDFPAIRAEADFLYGTFPAQHQRIHSLPFLVETPDNGLVKGRTPVNGLTVGQQKHLALIGIELETPGLPKRILETDIGFGISGCDAAIFSQSKIGCGSA